MQSEEVPGPPAHHEHRDRVPQRGVDHAHTDHLEHHQPLPETAAQGDYPGR